MKIYNYLFVGSMTLLFACSKNDAVTTSKTSDLIDGYTVAQIDSIAKHYGWKKLTTGQSSRSNAMKVNEFIALMEKRNQFTSKNGRTAHETVQLTVASTTSPGSVVVGQPTLNLYNLTWKFPQLKSAAYPSLYYMSFNAYSGLGGVTIHGVTFNYDGLDGPIATSDWSYNHLFSSGSGGTAALTVDNQGTETEVVEIAGYTYTNTYSVKFKIAQKPMLPGMTLLATIVLQPL